MIYSYHIKGFAFDVLQTFLVALDLLFWHMSVTRLRLTHHVPFLILLHPLAYYLLLHILILFSSPVPYSQDPSFLSRVFRAPSAHLSSVVRLALAGVLIPLSASGSCR